jgi:putative ABC transport system substrate-binding protein
VGAVGRRRFLAFSGALLAAPFAQAAERTYRVAIVLTTSPIAEMLGPRPAHPLTNAILDELRVLGYVEGRNLLFERRSAEGDPKRYRPIIDELVGLKCDAIILSGSRELIRAAQAATRAVPIVLMGYPNAVRDGFVTSLARPGGNITGATGVPGPGIVGKGVELLKEAVPAISRPALLAARDVPPAFRDSAFDAAKKLGFDFVPIEQHPTDPRASFAAIAKARVDGLAVMMSSTTYAQREQLGSLSLEARLPALFSLARIVETGGLMSYGANVVKDIRGISHYVDRILKGANPAELPMENALVFELVINLKTARVLGLTIPQSILLRADRVIE